MSSILKHYSLFEFVSLFHLHKQEILEVMPLPHAVNKLKGAKGQELISTGELCLIFTRSSQPLARRFCYSFGTQSHTDEQFDKMLAKLRKEGFNAEARELKRRSLSFPVIDIQHSANLLNGKSQRTGNSTDSYRDHSRFSSYKFLSGSAKGFAVDWDLLEQAINAVGVVADVPETTFQSTSRASANNDVVSDPDANYRRALQELDFDPANVEDARYRVLREVALRQGQPKFRSDLLRAYRCRCAVTGCDCVEALEAAHIAPYKGKAWNVTTNGLLLRADIHTLFDLHLLTVDPETYSVCLSSRLEGTSYADLRGRASSLPEFEQERPNREALSFHAKQLQP